MFAGAVITGIGVTVIEYDIGVPAQVPRIGVTVMTPVIGDPVAFVAVNPGTCPMPPAAKPIAGFELVQVYVATAGLLTMFPAATAVPAHWVMFAGAVITGNGLTVMV